MTRAAISASDKRGGLEASWAKIKFDRQIVAIGKVAHVSMIYSDDRDVRALAAAENIPVRGIAELPLPPEKAQSELQLEPPASEGQTGAAFAADETADTTDADEEPEPESEPEPEPGKPG